MRASRALLCAALLLAAPASGSNDAAFEAESDRLAGLVLEHLLQGQARVLRVADPIRVAAAPDCGREVGAILGAYFGNVATFRGLSEGDYDFEERVARAAIARFGLDRRPRALVVVPGLAGDRAGLRVGDVVVGWNGKPLTSRDDLEALRVKGDVARFALSVEREGQPLELDVELQRGCAHPAHAWFGNSVNAFAMRFGKRTGTYVLTGMLDFAPSDDELAVVLGHELAHLILWSGGTKRTEAEADYLGLYLAARAGFDVSVAPGFWERMGRANPYSSIDWGFYAHPTSTQRQLDLEATVKEIAAKRAAGKPLEVSKALTGLARPQIHEDAEAASAQMKAAALAELRAQRERVLRVHHRLRTGAVALCEDEVAPVLGAAVGRRRDVMYRKPEEAEEIFGLVDEVRILALLPGAPADAAGLRPGDILERVNGARIDKSQDVFAALRDRRDAAPALSVRRDGASLEIALPLVLGCQHDAMLVMDPSFDTTADRNREEIRVPVGLLRFARSDDELAIALAHQIAHHVQDTSLLTRGADEGPADRLGIRMAAAAGFDVSRAVELLERMGADDPGKLDDDPNEYPLRLHRRIGERVLALRAELSLP